MGNISFVLHTIPIEDMNRSMNAGEPLAFKAKQSGREEIDSLFSRP